MPNTIIHEKVGFVLSHKININSYNYYLGLLAPDSPNLERFAPKEERWPSHLRHQNLQTWRENLFNFYLQEKANYPKDFLVGYYIHILTDIIYDEYFYQKIKNKIIANNIPKELAHKIMTLDMDKYYFKEIEMIKNILSEGNDTYNINNISKELLQKFKNKQITTRWNLVNINKSEYIKEEDLYLLSNKVLKEVQKILE